jgi:hypothetical protein
MGKYVIVWLTLIPIIFSGCINNEYSDHKIEIKAQRVVKYFDSHSINVFHKWTYTTRGQGGYWFRFEKDSVLYSCGYYNDSDTTKLAVFYHFNTFTNDFPISIALDTTGYFRFIFSKFHNKIHITATDSNGRDHILLKNINLTNLFKDENPFSTLGNLTSLKDSLGIIHISRNRNVGNYTQFYLSSQHVLTYFPDSLHLNPKFKAIWMKEFATGKVLNKHWNLRKLSKPLDNG